MTSECSHLFFAGDSDSAVPMRARSVARRRLTRSPTRCGHSLAERRPATRSTLPDVPSAPRRYSDPSELASALPLAGVVLLDGDCGVGKSRLAKVLPHFRRCSLVHVDEHFLIGDRGRVARVHRDLVNWSSVRAALAAASARCELVILDSVCVAWVARELGVHACAHVLVTLTDPRAARFSLTAHSLVPGPGQSFDERALLDDSVSEADILARYRDGPGYLLARSVVAYFKAARPHRCATHFFTWPALEFRP